MSDKHPHAAIYARISDDREGRALGVARQQADCAALAERRGWTVAAQFVDNSVSASTKKKRPQYEAMLDAIRAGQISAVVVWDVDRLTRRPAELETFIDLAEKYGVQLASVGGEIDLATPQGRLTARIKGSVARHEAEQLSRRILRKVEELAHEGRIANGGPRPFGYTRVYAGEGPRRKILRDEINPDEAAVVRECARRLLAGETLRSVTNWLNESGVPTSTGARWSKQALRWMMRAGRIAGLRERNDKVVGKAVWPALITVEEHQQLRAMLDSHERSPGSRVRLHWLSGYVFCADCVKNGVKMRVGRHAGKLKYKCPADDGCNGRVISLEDLEDLVARYVVGRLADERFLRGLAARERTDDIEGKRLAERIEADERRLRLLKSSLESEDADEDEIPELVASMRTIRRRITEAREQLSRRTGVPAVVSGAAGVSLAEFKEYPLDTKQAILGFLVEKIVIGPGLPGRKWFDPDRVDILPTRPA